MSNLHIPAWKRINIVKDAQKAEGIDVNEDPLNVTTHLSTGSLTKRQKKQIINKTLSKGKENKVSKNTKDSQRNKIKVKKSERDSKPRILRDQVKYLIEFYLGKINDELPEPVKKLDFVSANLSIFNKKTDDDGGVIEVWKFSKQKQNWLLKHFFNIELIPVELNQLLFDYFELLNGFSKKQLVEECQKKIISWNDFIDEQEIQMAKLVEGDATEEEKKDADGSEDKTKNTTPSVDSEKPTETKLVLPPNKDEVRRARKMLETWLTVMKKKPEDHNREELDAFESVMNLKSFD
ncbi:hypothetical protein TPHA_0O00970 [Tetrapisispora phaffii CBS 4417]|uniref:WKF domain-containing protein n=1 Tax=Tetrapisispora phaffii (strain ATCC 24235 / CBS 4417 / NBRC 1672 / NRRL Y-8282 / UCD 70-5) TaxID=1071381 RepID=G8C1N8_TETPH|nr:hypothetical protein TPHA_0O00970 [Tetrapisispora phaffii CBS 4417]CCE66066.1 hypothetical protein TPHA_0O00970 [Tetrapisispora phaffii CBS 4417]